MKFLKLPDKNTLKAPYLANVSYLAVFFIVTLVFCQLFFFEKFIPIVQSFRIDNNNPSLAYFLAIIIVTAEIGGLPYLLRMKLSNVARKISGLMLILAPLVWTVACSLILVMGEPYPSNIGFFGSLIEIPFDTWAFYFSATCLVGAIWLFWGLVEKPKPAATKKAAAKPAKKNKSA